MPAKSSVRIGFPIPAIAVRFRPSNHFFRSVSNSFFLPATFSFALAKIGNCEEKTLAVKTGLKVGLREKRNMRRRIVLIVDVELAVGFAENDGKGSLCWLGEKCHKHWSR